MKKILVILLALVLVLSFAACASTAETTNEDSNAQTNETADTTETGDTDASAENTDASAEDAGAATEETTGAAFTTVEEGKLHMSTNAAFPPYEMVADGEGFQGTGYEGIDVEIAYAIAQKLGLELVVDDMDFTAALEAAQSGKSDMVMAGVTVNEDRLAVMDFSDSYATGVQVVIVTEDSPITTLDDIEGKLIGTQKGTTGYTYASDTPENGGYGEDAVIGFDNGLSAVQALKNGQVDCVIIDNAPARSFVAENPGLKILDTEWVTEDYAIGVAKGNTALLDAINGALAELIADGTVQGIIDTYITAE